MSEIAELHVTKYGTYHPNPESERETGVAWTVNDTRGYIDGGPACDECGACECETVDGTPLCAIEQDNGKPVESECVGLSFAYVCLDGGDALCRACADKEGITVKECDCPCEAMKATAPSLPEPECEVCGKTGKDARKCEFQRCCSCWHGVPCVNGESMRKRQKAQRGEAS